jgi:hypothetical protein
MLSCLCLSAFVAVSAPSRSSAESCEPAAASRADAHKQIGLKLRAADPAAAAREFEAADRICPDPWYAGLLAVCYEKTGRIIDAVGAIDAYLKSSDVGQREQAEAARGRLVAMLAKVEVVTEPPGAAVRLVGPGRETGVIAPAKLALDPGHYTLDVRLDGHEPQRRELDVGPGEDARLDVALVTTGSSATSETAPPDERPAERTLGWTGAAGLALDVAIPVATVALKTAAGIALDLCGGIELGRFRAELALQIHLFPASSGFILELVGGPRVGIRLGTIPLYLELDVLVGWSYMESDSEQALIPAGSYSGVSVSAGIAVAYRLLRWLEVFVRPARVEALNIANDDAGGSLFRWDVDVGVRFRR